MSPTVAFHTLGCKVNQYDSQAMLELFRAAGYQAVPFSEDADVYVINTCTVTGVGDKKSLQAARRIRREHPNSALILCGCLAQRKGEELIKELDAQLVIGTQHRAQIVELLEQALREKHGIAAVEPLPPGTPYEPLWVASQEEHTRAVMKIQEGCNNHCTYCIIPSVRGPIRSRNLDDIRKEARALSEAGFREIVLTGIHLTSYGKDFGDQSLLDAIRCVHAIDGIERIRLGSLEPTVATEAFAQALLQVPKVCPQFHLALQSGCDTVLQRMARRYNMRMYMEAVDTIRGVYPLAALTTDILTGFPGETDEEHRITCEAVQNIGFSRIHVFPYSPREGTKAAVMPGQIPREVKERRVRELIAIGEETSRQYRTQWLGRTAGVILEQHDEEGWHGYTETYIPVTVQTQTGDSGQLATVKLDSLTKDGMAGTLLSEQ
ncbi:MAG: tRNA (N(6)-L-threonylcarbamoyladenosine(37)-C(2))-methylthiotransferase MtaB [Clostridiales bacterium]|nr:tRNA (N(6)-L-threonylcarbamoyladenosine(37)-C(2))-methylthiotransferase MtaB [Clostridiales bacterium]